MLAALARHKVLRRFNSNHKLLIAIDDRDKCDCLEVVEKIFNAQAVTPQGVGSELQC